MMRFEGLLGEFSQHDFGEVRITCLDGTQEVVRFFCSRLKWLRWAAVDPVPDQVAQMLIPTLADHADPGDHRRWRCVDTGPRAPAPSRTHGKRRPRRQQAAPVQMRGRWYASRSPSVSCWQRRSGPPRGGPATLHAQRPLPDPITWRVQTREAEFPHGVRSFCNWALLLEHKRHVAS